MATNFANMKRDELMNIIREALGEKDFETLFVKANVFAIPVVLDDEEKTEGAFTITVSYKKGSREGDPYDPYTEEQIFREKEAEKARKAEELRKKKEADIKRREEEKLKKEELKRKREEEKAVETEEEAKEEE